MAIPIRLTDAIAKPPQDTLNSGVSLYQHTQRHDAQQQQRDHDDRQRDEHRGDDDDADNQYKVFKFLAKFFHSSPLYISKRTHHPTCVGSSGQKFDHCQTLEKSPPRVWGAELFPKWK